MLRYIKMVVLFLLLVTFLTFPQKSDAQSVALTEPPPENHKYEVIQYIDVHTAQRVWIIGVVESGMFDKVVGTIGVEGTAASGSVIVLIIREGLALLIRRRDS